MAETYIISDSHFGHKGVTEFLNKDGTKLRPFSNTVEMDEYMIEQWNKVVRPEDKVIHLGDVVINRKALNTIYRLNGKKKLIMGNHDIFRLEEYQEHFYDLRAYKVFDGFVMSHIPVHTSSIERWSGNIHGHLHSNKVMDGDRVDHRYLCMCVEQAHVNYTPVPRYLVKEIFNKQGESRV